MQEFIPLISDKDFVLALESALQWNGKSDINIINVFKPFADRIDLFASAFSKNRWFETHFSKDLGGASLPCAIL
jgi:hypothetical protein